MPKPTTVSLKDLQRALEAAEKHLIAEIGPGMLTLKIGRQELRA